jgi:beta-glucanase (GH16 family)
MRTATLIFCLTIVLLGTAQAAPESPPIAGDWKVTFEDNFDGNTLDGAKWKVGHHWAGMNGVAKPHHDNMVVKDGALVFTWDKKDKPFHYGHQESVYGTGEVSTYERFHQRYGYWETRMKYDVHRGCWPAIWTMPAAKRPEYKGETQWTYLQFDVSDTKPVPGKVLLKLRVKQPAQGIVFDVYGCTSDDWNETGLTWNARPPHDALFLAHVRPTVPAEGWIEVDVTRYVTDQAAEDGVVSIALVDTYQVGAKLSLYSTEAGADKAPRLVLDEKELLPAHDGYVYARTPEQSYGAEPELKVLATYAYGSDTHTPGMEIDIHEPLGIWGPHRTQHAWHWDGYGKDHKSEHHAVKNTADQNEYRTFGLYWTQGKLEFYMDGELTHTHVGTEVGAVSSYLLLSAQVGGWDENGADLEKNFDPFLPKTLSVDYVKIWQGKKHNDEAYTPPVRPERVDIYSDSSTMEISVGQKKGCETKEVTTEAHEGTHSYEIAYDFDGWYGQAKFVMEGWSGRFPLRGYDAFQFAYKGAEGLELSTKLVHADGTVTELGKFEGSANWQVVEAKLPALKSDPQSIQFDISGAEKAKGMLYLDAIAAE